MIRIIGMKNWNRTLWAQGHSLPVISSNWVAESQDDVKGLYGTCKSIQCLWWKHIKQFQSKELCGDFNLATVCISVPVFIDMYEVGLFSAFLAWALSGWPQKCYLFCVHYGPPDALCFLWMCKKRWGTMSTLQGIKNALALLPSLAGPGQFVLKRILPILYRWVTHWIYSQWPWGNKSSLRC